jgi:hypothetical protein
MPRILFWAILVPVLVVLLQRPLYHPVYRLIISRTETPPLSEFSLIEFDLHLSRNSSDATVESRICGSGVEYIISLELEICPSLM